MVGSTQIMIKKQVYKELIQYRNKNGFKSFTVAIKSLLDLQSQIARTYVRMPIHTVQAIQVDDQGVRVNDQTLPEKVEVEKTVISWEGEGT